MSSPTAGGRSLAASTRPSLVLALAFAGLVVALAGCVRHSPGSERAQFNTTGAAPDLPASDCQQFAAALYSLDTTSDPSRGAAAAHRIQAYITVQLAQATSGRDAAAGGDVQWGLWVRHEAYIVAMAADASEERPVDRPDRAYRAATVTVTARGRDGWRGPDERHIVFCRLTLEHGRWLIDRYTLG